MRYTYYTYSDEMRNDICLDFQASFQEHGYPTSEIPQEMNLNGSVGDFLD